MILKRIQKQAAELPEWVENTILAHGFTPDILQFVHYETRPGLFEHFPQRGHLSIGYEQGGRFHETAIYDTHREVDMEAFIADEIRFPSFLARAVKAMPNFAQPKLPAFAEASILAEATQKHKDRATRLAKIAAQDAYVKPYEDAVSDLPRPF